MEFKRMRHLLSCTRRAIDDYNMIEDGDRLCVGLSGGKDSIALLCALANLKMFYPKRFELSAVSISMGFPDMDFSPIENFCKELNIDYTVKQTELAHIIFDVRKESNPCSLCAKMRRGLLHDAAKEQGCNKVALGHHFDDLIETFMLNLFNEGRLGGFYPVTYMSRKDITVIRPLIYAYEKDVRYFVTGNDVPIVQNPCPEDGHTEREKMKVFISGLERENKGLKHRIFLAMQKDGLLVQQEYSD